MSTYAEKAAAFGAPAYAVQTFDNSEYYRQQQAYVAAPGYPQGHVAYGAAQAFGTAPSYAVQQQGALYGYTPMQDGRTDGRMAAFNPGAPPPNFARPPPAQIGKTEDAYQAANNPIRTMLKNTTGASFASGGISAFDAGVPSSAAYTASWGSTAAVSQMVGEFGQWNNPDQSVDSGVASSGSNVYSQSAAQTMDQFAKMNVNEQQANVNYDNSSAAWGNAGDQRHQQQPQQQQPQPQQNSATQLAAQHWPGLNAANDKAAKDKKREERERRQREEPRELTWEERLRKAQGAKERAENPKFEKFDRGERIERDPQTAGDVRGRGRGGRGGLRGGRGGKADGAPENGEIANGQPREQRWNGQRRQPMAPTNGSEGDMNNVSVNRPIRGGMLPRGGSLPLAMTPMHPMMFRGGPPPQGMLPPPHFMQPGGPMPPMMAPQAQQDQRFRNSWLDANLFVPPFPMPFPPMGVPPMMGGMRGARGVRGRGAIVPRGRGGKRMPNGKDEEKRGEASEEEKSSPAPAEEIDAESEEHEEADEAEEEHAEEQSEEKASDEKPADAEQ